MVEKANKSLNDTISINKLHENYYSKMGDNKKKLIKTPFLFILPILLILNVWTIIKTILRNDFSAIGLPIFIASLLIIVGFLVFDRFLTNRIKIRKIIVGETIALIVILITLILS